MCILYTVDSVLTKWEKVFRKFGPLYLIERDIVTVWIISFGDMIFHVKLKPHFFHTFFYQLHLKKNFF